MRRSVLGLIGLLWLAPSSVWAQPSENQGPVGEPGPKGRPAVQSVDPSENVKALNEAGMKAVAEKILEAIRRQDDLRLSDEKLNSERAGRLNEISMMRKELVDAEIRRIDAEAKITASYSALLRDAEAKRIDAIRAVDVQAVASANEKSNATAATLANQVSQSAADLRTLVASTAATQSANQQQQFADIGKRISTLEQTASTNQGKSTYTDPQLASMSLQIERLVAKQNDAAGVNAGQKDTYGQFYLFAGLLVAAAGVGFAMMRKPMTDPALAQLLSELARDRPSNERRPA